LSTFYKEEADLAGVGKTDIHDIEKGKETNCR